MVVLSKYISILQLLQPHENMMTIARGKKKSVLILLPLLLLFQCKAVSAARSVSYYDDLIVFTFKEDYPAGQFLNGDYWIHNNGANVTITSISPASRDNGDGRIINGTMVNPENSSTQGYDSSPRDMGYAAALNRDPGITGNPLTLSPGSSVVKSISMASDAGRPIISDAAVLTVLSGPPPENSFRPPYTGSDKSIPATEEDLDYSQLGRYKRLGSEPDIEVATRQHERVWLEHCTEWVQRDIHPQNNMPAYGRDIAMRSATAILLLQLDYTNQEKRELLIHLVQYGLDIYGVALSGGNWYNNGGHNLGRKLPLLLAGIVLNNENILDYGNKEKQFIFQDDQQHFYVSQREVDITHSPDWRPDNRAEPIPYTAADIGMVEWGIRHATEPERNNRNWGATYRGVVGPAQTITVFAARLLGAQKLWNWPAVFDYADRYYAIEQPNGRFPVYFVDLWEKYRAEVSRPTSLLNLLPLLKSDE